MDNNHSYINYNDRSEFYDIECTDHGGFMEMVYAFSKDTFQIQDLNNYNIHVAYLNTYFNTKFTPYDEIKIINRFINHYFKGGCILDIGAGFNTPFWFAATDISKISYIDCTDISIEPFILLKDMSLNKKYPYSYYGLCKFFNVKESTLDDLTRKIKTIHIFDAFDIWPDSIINQKYTLITQFGLLGLASSIKAIKTTIHNIQKILNKNGYFIGMTWIPRKKPFFNKSNYHTLSVDDLSEIIINSASRVFELKKINLNEKNYSNVLIWVIK